MRALLVSSGLVVECEGEEEGRGAGERERVAGGWYQEDAQVVVVIGDKRRWRGKAVVAHTDGEEEGDKAA